MSRKKRTSSSQAHSALNRVIAYCFLLLAFVGCFGLGTVYLRHQSAETANEIKRVERRISLEKRNLAELGTELSRLTTRDALKRFNRQYDLGLAMPRDRQVVRVTENVESRLYEKNSGSLVTASKL